MNFFFDFKYAARLLMRSPGFLALTVTAMAAGLGLSFYMLAFLDHIWARPLPFENGENMVAIIPTLTGEMSGAGVSTHEFHALKDGTTSFSMMGAYNELGRAELFRVRRSRPDSGACPDARR
jgi:hypothetical protein